MNGKGRYEEHGTTQFTSTMESALQTVLLFPRGKKTGDDDDDDGGGGRIAFQYSASTLDKLKFHIELTKERQLAARFAFTAV